MKRWDIINRLIEVYGYNKYLEIGVDNPSICFDKINIKQKTGVDPNGKATFKGTSDEFFKINKKNKFDIIFIDGLHHCEQVIKDIENSLRVIMPNGSIVVHDCNPTTEAMQLVPRIQGEWTGDVWKAWLHFRTNPDLSMHVLDTDYGVGVIRRGKQKPLEVKDPDYYSFEYNKHQWLNLIPVENQPISICIPTYEQYGHGVSKLKECLDSIFVQRGQYEVIISDNSDNDSIQKLCESYKVRYFHNPVKGISYNTNNAISKASFKYIKPMYQDDKFINKDAVNDISFALKFDQWLFSNGKGMDGSSKFYRNIVPVYTKDILQGVNRLGMPSMMAYHKNDIEFDTKLKTRLDCDFYYQLKEIYGEPGYIKKQLIGARYWEHSQSSKQGNFTKEEWPYLKKKHGL